MYLVRPALQRYDWGTTTDLPDLLGFAADGRPWAEAWWGAHPAAPATAEVGGTEVALDELIAADPAGALGDEVARENDGTLPYLLKVLAIAKPLSIQVHPSAEVAEEGFWREEAEGIDRDAPNRVYRDTRHKPEMVVALSPMAVLSGFRSSPEVARDLVGVGGEVASRLADALASEASEPLGIAAFLRAALTDPESAAVVAAIARAGTKPGASPNLAAAAAAARHFRGDPGVLVALAMNLVELAPGEACYTPDGIVHSYQSGVGLEIMANSDNVIRAGLTSKHIDIPALLEVARTAPSAPHLPAERHDGDALTYTSTAREFRLTTIADGRASVDAGPRIVLCLEGETRVRSGVDEERLARGQAVFVPYSDGAATVRTTGRAAIATVPRPVG